MLGLWVRDARQAQKITCGALLQSQNKDSGAGTGEYTV